MSLKLVALFSLGGLKNINFKLGPDPTGPVIQYRLFFLQSWSRDLASGTDTLIEHCNFYRFLISGLWYLSFANFLENAIINAQRIELVFGQGRGYGAPQLGEKFSLIDKLVHSVFSFSFVSPLQALSPPPSCLPPRPPSSLSSLSPNLLILFH